MARAAGQPAVRLVGGRCAWPAAAPRGRGSGDGNGRGGHAADGKARVDDGNKVRNDDDKAGGADDRNLRIVGGDHDDAHAARNNAHEVRDDHPDDHPGVRIDGDPAIGIADDDRERHDRIDDHSAIGIADNDRERHDRIDDDPAVGVADND